MTTAELARAIAVAHEAGDEVALREAIRLAVVDVAEHGALLVKQRGRTARAAPGIMAECDARWRAIVNRVPPGILNPNGWREMIDARVQEVP